MSIKLKPEQEQIIRDEIRRGRFQTAEEASVVDGLFSATALEHNLTVFTRNSADFVTTGVALFNPWRI